MDLTGLPFVIQDMELEDVPGVSALERRIFTLPWPAKAFEQELLYHRDARFLVLRYVPWFRRRETSPLRPKFWQRLRAEKVDESIIGYGGLWLIIDEAHICTLAVHPDWRGRGLGELLLVALIERAMQMGAEIVTLEVRLGNHVAQSLYLKYGFQKVGRRRRYYSDNREDALIMTIPEITGDAYRERFAALKDALRRRLESESKMSPAHSTPCNLQSL